MFFFPACVKRMCVKHACVCVPSCETHGHSHQFQFTDGAFSLLPLFPKTSARAVCGLDKSSFDKHVSLDVILLSTFAATVIGGAERPV